MVLKYNSKTGTFEDPNEDPNAAYIYDKYVKGGWRDEVRRHGGGGGGSSSEDNTAAEQLRIAQEKDAQARAAAIVEAQIRYAEQQKARKEKIKSGTIAGQIENAKDKKIDYQGVQYSTVNQFGKGTQITTNRQFDSQIFTEPTVYSIPAGTIKDSITGQEIPLYKMRYTEGAFSGVTGRLDRLATKEEEEYFLQQQKSVEKGSKSTAFGVFKTKVSEYKSRAGETIEPVTKVSNKIETNLVGLNTAVGEKVLGKGKTAKSFNDFGSGVIKGVIPSTNTEVAITAASFGVGAIVGGGARALGATTSKIIPKAAPKISKVFGLGGAALGVAYGGSKAVSFINAPSATQKGEIVGSTARELYYFEKGFRGGSKAAGIGIGEYRTRGMTDLPSDVIIAPEYPKQNYPQIKKGQTAGQLLEEFKQPEIFGVTRLSGFTAAPRPLSGKTFGKGSSELPGFYQAPKLSPNFLGLGKSKSYNPFNLDVLPGGLPSAFLTKPKSYELVPGVKPGQKNLGSLKSAKEFFINEAEKGKSYEPFIKTEKEAIIPEGTEFRKTRDMFYFKHEGEKIPMTEIETIYKPNYKTKGGTKGKRTGKAFNGKSKETISSEDIIARSRYSGSSSGTLKSFVYLSSPKYKQKKISSIKSSSSVRNVYSSGGYNKPSYPYRYGGSGSNYNGKGSSYFYPSRKYTYSSGGGRSSVIRFKYNPPIYPRKKRIRFGGDSVSKGLRLKQPLKYTPSLTGSVRYNMLGKRATASKKDILAAKGLPLIRPVMA